MAIRLDDDFANKNLISFKADNQNGVKPAQDKESTPPKKPFYERNKSILTALGIIGAVGIAIGTYRHFNAKSIKDAGEQALDKMTKEAEQALETFKNKLSSSTEDCTQDINSILKNDNLALRLEGINFLSSKEMASKYINNDNFESILDTVLSMKPTDNLKEETIKSSIYKYISALKENNLVSHDNIDKILSKMSGLSDDRKLNIFENLIEGHYVEQAEGLPKQIMPEFSRAQLKNIVQELDSIGQNEFKYNTGFFIYNYKTAGVKFKYLSEYFCKANKVNDKYIQEFSDVMSNKNQLTDELKLQLIHDVHYSLGEKAETPEGIKLHKIMMNEILQNSAIEFKKPNMPMTLKNNKFDIGASISSHIHAYDKNGICSEKEQLEFIKYLRSINPYEENHIINTMNIDEISLKMKLFEKDFTEKTSINDLEKFVDELLENFKNAKENFVDSKLFGGIQDELLSMKFKIFYQSANLNSSKIGLNCIFDNSGKFEEFVKVNERINKKIDDFSDKYFRISGHKANSGNKFNADDFVKNNTTQAKNDIIEFLSKDEDFAEFVEKLKTAEPNKDFIRKLKQKVVIKYHPDRLDPKTETEKAKVTADFQKIKGAVEILEKIFK